MQNSIQPILLALMLSACSAGGAETSSSPSLEGEPDVTPLGAECPALCPAGPQGEAGPAGPQGPAGPAGPQGPAGPAGTSGALGPTGEPGALGQQGEQGEQGQQGVPGEIGPTGLPGSPGVKGDKGDPGATGQPGAQGAVGPAGKDGISITKDQVYRRDVTGGPGTSYINLVTALCDDENDVLLTGGCAASPTVAIRAFAPITQSVPDTFKFKVGYGCGPYNTLGPNEQLVATVICLDVP